MPLIDKGELIKALRAVASFDNGSPYVAVYVDGDKPTLYRSSPFGFIQSVNVNYTDRSVCVSLSQLQDRLRVLPEDRVNLDVDASGILTITSVDNIWNNELRVHTVKLEQSGLKSHIIGEVNQRFGPELFEGFNAKPFPVASFPFLMRGKIMVPTVNGIILWQGGPELANVSVQPRDQFLKFLANGAKAIFITDKGYWGAETESLLSFTGTHNGSPALFQAYDVPGTKLCTYPASRLCYALNAAAALGTNVEMTSATIQAKDSHGLLSKFDVGGDTDVKKFSLYSKTAKLIVDALEQTKEETAVLSTVIVGNHPTMRLDRGPWSVNFKIF